MSSSNKPPFYECQYCSKKIINYDVFLKHSCEKKKRTELCKTKTGLNAFLDYSYWLTKNNRAVPKIETFIDSKFFNSFVNFQSFCIQKGIPDKNLYIEFMLSKKISPMLWRSQSLYDAFVQHFDQDISPEIKIKITIKTLKTIASILECQMSDVFGYLLPSELSRLVYERRISPWVLLFSDKFKQYLHNLKDASQHIMLSTTIDPIEWRNRFNADKKSVELAKTYVQQLGI